MKIGVLDIQGSVEEHAASLARAAEEMQFLMKMVMVKTPKDLENISGLILPGGESTTMSKLLNMFSLREAILNGARQGIALWGTCAGAILLSKELTDPEKVEPLELMDIKIARNAYGRQVDSFETEIEFDFGENKMIPAVFIRAPKIIEVGGEPVILAKNDGEIVAVRQKNFLATTFHPELTEDSSVHKYFIEMCKLRDF
jgi:5'-phosphate synthase pdxT subunit